MKLVRFFGLFLNFKCLAIKKIDKKQMAVVALIESSAAVMTHDSDRLSFKDL